MKSGVLLIKLIYIYMPLGNMHMLYSGGEQPDEREEKA